MEDDELGPQEKYNDFARCYANDIDGIELYKEIKVCQMFYGRSETNIAEPKSPVDLLHLIISRGDDVFPNLRISLQILSTNGSSIASCERCFSKLKLILTYLRATISQTRLSDLAILNIEAERLENIDFNPITDAFASAKARKVFV